MRLLETAKFKKQRKKLRSALEKQALKKAIIDIMENPLAGKKLKGELSPYRSLRFSAGALSQRLIYQIESDSIILVSFGPRQGIYKS
ncbi:MAG: type II toxin-antitoxin system RelE/ParE family toxin [Acidobacteria bacterium]|nr:type II toxin-antitoxin system RelE/ParE family toxin [Acidobacteriota bacterium]MBU4307285.1 type II toxin-antitoxin system RelE/ParE family toxin [Acidobacteriota bacterium]MBU4405769.1 type II toxin-antitoxin system RelE/ParE family toxin [Acidobacteriota bacterium]MCG2812477.1 type II toxin-antitoxin system RelE/ParE family toxin [Candidatus Aminicenantes bacterium]